MKTAGKSCTSTSPTHKVTGQAFAARTMVENWDCSSSRQAVPQWEMVLPVLLRQHPNYPTIGTVTTTSSSRTHPGHHRQAWTRLQPQNWNGNPGTLTRLGTRGSLSLKFKKPDYFKNKKFPATHVKSSAVFGNKAKNIVKSFQNVTLIPHLRQQTSFPDFPETPASRQALPERHGALQAERQQSKSHFHSNISCHWSWCTDTLGNTFSRIL